MDGIRIFINFRSSSSKKPPCNAVQRILNPECYDAETTTSFYTFVLGSLLEEEQKKLEESKRQLAKALEDNERKTAESRASLCSSGYTSFC